MRFSTCTQDDSLGPTVSGCRDDFDFTVKFEMLVFSIVPSSLFILFGIWRTCTLARKPAVVDGAMLQLIKLGTIMAYIGLHMAILILVGIRSFDVTETSIASTVLQFLAAVCMVPVSFLDHSRSPRPSILMSVYLLLTLLFDITRARTFWLASGTRPELTYTTIFTASVALKAVILFLEAQRKTRFVKWDSKEHSPEETSGIYSLGAYLWLNKLFSHGYSRILQMDDLYPLDFSMRGKALNEQFSKHADFTHMKGRTAGLLKILSRTLAVPLLLPVLPRLALMGFMFCQPLFIESLLTHLAKPEAENSSNIGYGYIGAAFLIYSGIAVSTALYWYLQQRMLLKLRGVLIGAIYKKATDAQLGSTDPGSSLTLMSTDIERMNLGFRAIHDIWAAFFEVGIAAYLLYNQLGLVFLVPIVVIILCALGLSSLVNFTAAAAKAWMASVQRRVSLTSTTIAEMKSLKLSGLTAPIQDAIQELRVAELGSGARSRKLMINAAVFAFVPLLFSPFITFSIAQGSMDPARMFTSYSYLILVANPLISIFQIIPSLIAALTCLGRIQKFLEADDRQDFRSIPGGSQPGEADSEKTGLSPPEQDPSPAAPAIALSSGRFGWESDKQVLQDINVKIARSALTVVCGPVGSGKTSLCKALLGEIPSHSGTVALDTAFRRVGYCDQVPFLSNGTIKDNIIGFTPFDEERYENVISAAMLEADLDLLSSGDMTNVGSNGITLSGGQKQRVALARALYLHTDLLILDDIFSGLDKDTEAQVFCRVFGPDGLLRRRNATAILCTHSIKYLPNADFIVALGENGVVMEQGTFAQLMAKGGYVQGLNITSASSDSSSVESMDFTASLGEKSAKSPKRRPAESAPSTTSAPCAVSSPGNERQLGDSTVYVHYLKSMGGLIAGLSLLTAVIYGFLPSFSNVWLSYWAAASVENFPSHSSAFYAGIYAMLNILALIALYICAWLCFISIVTRSGANLHFDILRTLVRAPLRFFTTTDNGQTTNLFSQDLNLIDVDLPGALLNTITSFFDTIAAAAVVMSAAPQIGVSYPFFIALLYFIQKFYLRTSRQMRLLDLEAKSPLYTHFRDTTHGIDTLRAFGYIPEDREKNFRLLDTSQRPAYLLVMIQQWLMLVMNMMVMVISVILTALAVKLRSDAGFTGASLVSLMSFGEKITWLIISYTQLETSIGAVTRLRSFNQTVTAEDREEEDVVPADSWPKKGLIELKGVSASYNPETVEGKEPELALRNVELTIMPGEKMAICGRTGSGKSSLIAFLLKLVDPLAETGAKAFIDHTPLHLVDRSALRRRIIAVPQEAVFLPDGTSFKINLDPFRLASLEDCQSVLEAVDLWPFVEERGGLEAGMSPGTLSQGQKQLFSLARAVLRRRLRSRNVLGSGDVEGGVLLLDEFSSSVDQDTEKLMQDIIRVEFKGYTVVAVSHRLDMIMDFDRVVVMSKGEIVEVGPPKALAADANTNFGELWRASGN